MLPVDGCTTLKTGNFGSLEISEVDKEKSHSTNLGSLFRDTEVQQRKSRCVFHTHLRNQPLLVLLANTWRQK